MLVCVVGCAALLFVLVLRVFLPVCCVFVCWVVCVFCKLSEIPWAMTDSFVYMLCVWPCAFCAALCAAGFMCVWSRA